MIGDFSSIQNANRQMIGLKNDTPNYGDIGLSSLNAKFNGLLGDSTGLYEQIYGITADTTLTANTTYTSYVKLYKNLTINAGITLNTSLYGMFIACETLTLGSSAIITASGKGASGGASVIPVSGVTTAGNAGTSVVNSFAGGGGSGGGAVSPTGVGGAGGATILGQTQGGIYTAAATSGLIGLPLVQDRHVLYNPVALCGSGGGSGAGYVLGTGTTKISGAGGAGGGFVIIACKNLVLGANAKLIASGIAGGNASRVGWTDYGLGGGGGGGGGTIIVSAHNITGDVTIDITGGAAGTKVQSGGVGIAQDGGAGAAGISIIKRW